MSFLDIEIKKEYRSLSNSIVREFYVPLLRKAKLYQRAVGFFSSSALVEISKGISELVKNGGNIQLVASPHLSNEDIEAIRSGYKKREEIIKEAIIRNIKNPQSIEEQDRLNL